jgi:hypothetical protein
MPLQCTAVLLRLNALTAPEANAARDGLCCVTSVEQLSGTFITKHLQQQTATE